MTIEEQLEILTLENKMLREQKMKLETRISELEDILRKASLHINSSNSSKPPSSDIYRPKRNKSLREKSGENRAVSLVIME